MEQFYKTHNYSIERERFYSSSSGKYHSWSFSIKPIHPPTSNLEKKYAEQRETNGKDIEHFLVYFNLGLGFLDGKVKDGIMSRSV